MKKYNIYRDLFEIDLLAIEIRAIDKELAESARHIILRNKEICYITPSPNKNNSVDLLILGSFGIFRDIAKDIVAVGNEDLGYKISRLLQNYNKKENHTLHLNGKDLTAGRSLIMGILNITPDSFSDGGKFFNKPDAVAQGLKLIDEGADIIDIGGESTRPGAIAVDTEEELKRVIPVIEEIKIKRENAVISIDTRKAEVADKAIKAGASVVNDVSGFEHDEKMTEVCSQHKVPVILMHMKGTPETMQDNPFYDDVVSDIYDYLFERIKYAESKGISNIIIDPGIGFGKRAGDNFELLERLNEFKGIGKPILVGLSKKSLVGKVLSLNLDERKEATLAAETLSIKNGASIIRTHEVKQALQAAELCKYFENPELANNG